MIKYFKKLSNKFIFNSIIVLGMISLLSTSLIYYQKYSICSGIIEYDSKIDRDFILSLFDKYMYWLVAENVTGFDAKYVLDTKSRTKRPEDFGKLSIYVYRTPECKPAGFVSFYKKTFYKGIILFLVVDEIYRRQGYAKQLINFAFDQLKNMGCTYAELVTRTNNDKAQGLYKSVGMHEVWHDDGFINFEKKL